MIVGLRFLDQNPQETKNFQFEMNAKLQFFALTEETLNGEGFFL